MDNLRRPFPSALPHSRTAALSYRTAAPPPRCHTSPPHHPPPSLPHPHPPACITRTTHTCTHRTHRAHRTHRTHRMHRAHYPLQRTSTPPSSMRESRPTSPASRCQSTGCVRDLPSSEEREREGGGEGSLTPSAARRIWNLTHGIFHGRGPISMTTALSSVP